MIRRLKKEVLQQLPPKHRNVMRIQIDDTSTRAKFQDMLSVIAEYEERLKKNGNKKEDIVIRRTMTTMKFDNSDDDADPAELQARKKNVLMTLFSESGKAKLPAGML